MKSLQLANIAVGFLLAAFTAGAQTPAVPASSDPGNSNQDVQQSPSGTSAVPGLTDERANAIPSPQEDSTPSVPGTSNENKADPTDQNNPK
ncbi:MAG TPA: hypothetical protein VGR65_07090 [Casimicrobiaceae bacterium]|jgi:hypothetical protein|nr:hypothetical protein [Casimicrobiaceae bacterium]